MKRKDFDKFVNEIIKNIKNINDLKKLCNMYNGYNFNDILFDFEHENYIFTIAIDCKNKIYLVDNVDVWHNKHDYFMGNFKFNIDKCLTK